MVFDLDFDDIHFSKHKPLKIKVSGGYTEYDPEDFKDIDFGSIGKIETENENNENEKTYTGGNDDIIKQDDGAKLIIQLLDNIVIFY